MNFDFHGSTATGALVVRRDPKARAAWAAARRAREVEMAQSCPYRRNTHWEVVPASLMHWGLRLAGLADRGHHNARLVLLTAYDVACPGLPAAFEGYRIAHLSNLHLGFIDGTKAALQARLAGAAVDLCVLTGDYWPGFSGDEDDIAARVAAIVQAASPCDGVLATLGNHDSLALGDALERLGMPVLGNEAATLRHGDGTLSVVGIDDTWQFNTPAATAVLNAAPDGFKILLTHTPQLAGAAARAGYDLYFCGHTHGGQICLPGEVPIHTGLGLRRRHAARGAWKRRGMTWITNAGGGGSMLPMRFNCPAEAVVVTLRRGD